MKGKTMKIEIAKIKKNIKHYAPEIFVGASVIAGVATLAYLYNKEEDEVLVPLSNDEWATLKSGDAVKIDSDIGTIYIAKEYHTE